MRLTRQKVVDAHTLSRTLMRMPSSSWMVLPTALIFTVVFSLSETARLELARSCAGRRLKMLWKTARANTTGCTSRTMLCASRLISRILNALGANGGRAGGGGGRGRHHGACGMHSHGGGNGMGLQGSWGATTDENDAICDIELAMSDDESAIETMCGDGVIVGAGVGRLGIGAPEPGHVHSGWCVV